MPIGNCAECGKRLGDPRSTHCRTHAHLKVGKRPKRTPEEQRAVDRARSKERYATDPAYRARKKAATDRRRLFYRRDGDLTEAEWKVLNELYRGFCAYCLSPAEVIDHVTPLALGGEHTSPNVVPACEACNLSKGDRLLIEWGGR